MVFLHMTGEHFFDITHHSIIFGAGIIAGVSYIAYKVFSRSK